MHLFPLVAGVPGELGDQLDRAGRADGEVPGRAAAVVADRVDGPGGDEDGGARRCAAPLCLEQVVDLAVEYVEPLVEILVPVRDPEAAARWKLAFQQPDLSAERRPDLDRRPSQAQLECGARARRHDQARTVVGHGASPFPWLQFISINT